MFRPRCPTLYQRFVRWIVRRAGLALCAAGCASAIAGTDLHAYWDERCLACHGHAADFSRRFLRVKEGRLLGWHHREDLVQFLRTHYAADEYAPALYAMLLAQREAEPVYREKCAGCHQRAAELVRASIVMREGRLATRRGGQDLAEFLKTHGGANADQLPGLLDTLRRVYRETGGGTDEPRVEPAPAGPVR